MNIINDYLDRKFSNLPPTSLTLETKEKVQTALLSKYNQLLRDGLEEHEALSIVIKESGNIDTLVRELSLQEYDESSLSTTAEEVYEYLNTKRTSSILAGLGIFFLILAPGLLIFFSELGFFISNSDLEIIPFIISIAFGIGLLMYSNFLMKPYQMTKHLLPLSKQLQNELMETYLYFQKPYYINKIISITIMILSITPLIVFSSHNLDHLALLIFFIMNGIAITLLTSFSGIKKGYHFLLQDFMSKEVKSNHTITVNRDYNKSPVIQSNKKENRTIRALRRMSWPSATLIFLLLGFVFGLWKYAWLIFIFNGFLEKNFRAILDSLSDDDDNTP